MNPVEIALGLVAAFFLSRVLNRIFWGYGKAHLISEPEEKPRDKPRRNGYSPVEVRNIESWGVKVRPEEKAPEPYRPTERVSISTVLTPARPREAPHPVTVYGDWTKGPTQQTRG